MLKLFDLVKLACLCITHILILYIFYAAILHHPSIHYFDILWGKNISSIATYFIKTWIEGVLCV